MCPRGADLSIALLVLLAAAASAG
eukprot:COSAG06_NODE_54673_length_293_cov_1.030928_1_plen_23_part_01